MKATLFLALLAGLALAGCKPKPAAPGQAPQGSENPLDAPGRYGNVLVQAQKQAVKTVDLAGVNQAIKMFHAQEGRFPKTLDELVSPDYLPKLPDLPQGLKYDYQPDTGEVKIVPN
ncbi:MAG: hypothetical protein JXQ71_07485 [Verrucomicrobia bacterium]|nr:hypothetical protein [Verrucomicrobiota bacterium]